MCVRFPLVLFLCLFLCVTSAARAGDSCYPGLPDPIVVVESLKEIDDDGETLIEVNFDVPNWESFPDELFETREDLDACWGAPTGGRRSNVTLYAGDGTRLNGYCSFGSASSLRQIRTVRNCAELSLGVYFEIEDRLCPSVLIRSNTVPIECVTPVAPASWGEVKVAFR